MIVPDISALYIMEKGPGLLAPVTLKSPCTQMGILLALISTLRVFWPGAQFHALKPISLIPGGGSGNVKLKYNNSTALNQDLAI